MNCGEARLLLDDLLDGTIAGDRRRALEAHLAGCEACRSEAEGLRALLAGAAALPESVEPARDLWPGIAARIAEGNVVAGEFGRARRRLPLAAAAAALVAATALVTALAVRSGRSPHAAAVPAAGSPGAVPAAFALGDARGAYEAARRQLLAALDARRGSLSPATLKVVDENLRVIERAVAEMEDALAHDPGNRELPALIASAYRQEIDVLRVAAGIPARG